MIAMVLLWSINLRIVRGWTTEDPPESHYRHCLTKCWHQFEIPAIIVPHNTSCLFSSPPLAKAAVWRQESLRNVKTHFSLRIRHLLELQSWASSPALGSFYRSAANSDNSGVLIVTTTHTHIVSRFLTVNDQFKLFMTSCSSCNSVCRNY